MAWSVGGVYKKTSLNLLNAFFIMNLGVLSLLKIMSKGKKKTAIVYFSASLALLTLLCVLVSHVLQRLRLLCRRCKRKRVLFMRMPLGLGVDEAGSAESSGLLPQLREQN